MEIIVQFLDLPETVAEMVTENEDGTHTIFLNSKMTCEKQRKAYLHALDHIERDDFRSGLTAQEIEANEEIQIQKAIPH